MAFGRLNGDTWIPKVGSKRMAITGSLVAASGFLLAIGLVMLFLGTWMFKRLEPAFAKVL
mgnify:CR=1 FL=1